MVEITHNPAYSSHSQITNIPATSTSALGRNIGQAHSEKFSLLGVIA